MNPTNDQPAVQVDSSRKSVLLIEDDPLFVKMYRTKFESNGLNVYSALNGEEGMLAAFSKKVDIIILDLLMPKMSGIDFLTQLRQNEQTKDIPVIVLTNLSQKEDQMKVLELGVKEYLIKANLTPTQVLEKIKLYI